MPWRFLAACVLVLLSGCQTARPIHPMQGQADTQQLTAEEQRVWYTARELDEQMEKADYLYEDAALQAYVFAILTCLYLNDALHPGH